MHAPSSYTPFTHVRFEQESPYQREVNQVRLPAYDIVSSSKEALGLWKTFIYLSSFPIYVYFPSENAFSN